MLIKNIPTSKWKFLRHQMYQVPVYVVLQGILLWERWPKYATVVASEVNCCNPDSKAPHSNYDAVCKELTFLTLTCVTTVAYPGMSQLTFHHIAQSALLAVVSSHDPFAHALFFLLSVSHLQ